MRCDDILCLLLPAVLFYLLPVVSCGCRNGSVEIGVCLHTYLERDFSDIERIVYPRKSKSIQPHGYHTTPRPPLMDGPELEFGCSRMNEVVLCLEGVLQDCQYYEDFYRLRHLVYSLQRTTEWLCGGLRDRFLVLLVSAECIDQQREKYCHRDQLPNNVVQKVLRLEIGQEQCKTFLEQRKCLLASESLSTCGVTAEEVYENMTKVFLHTWCLDDRILPYLSTAVNIKLNNIVVIAMFVWTKVFVSL